MEQEDAPPGRLPTIQTIWVAMQGIMGAGMPQAKAKRWIGKKGEGRSAEWGGTTGIQVGIKEESAAVAILYCHYHAGQTRVHNISAKSGRTKLYDVQQDILLLAVRYIDCAA